MRKWIKRILWMLLTAAILWAIPLAWLGWGWRSEQDAIAQIEARGGSVWTERISLPGPQWILPQRWAWLRDRVYFVIHRSAGDADLILLQRLKELRKLDLGDSKVTDAGLVHLKSLMGLRWLWLNGTQVTDAGVAELKKAIPNCDIRH